MKSARSYAVVFVTAPDLKTARRLAKLALESRLVACANLIPQIESHYWWQGKTVRSREILVVFKTHVLQLKALEQLVLEHHPYDTPEFIALPLSHGTPRYLTWITNSLSA